VMECWKSFNIADCITYKKKGNGCNKAWNGQCMLAKPMEWMCEWF
jgi:hypothetical protein